MHLGEVAVVFALLARLPGWCRPPGPEGRMWPSGVCCCGASMLWYRLAIPGPLSPLAQSGRLAGSQQLLHSIQWQAGLYSLACPSQIIGWPHPCFINLIWGP